MEKSLVVLNFLILHQSVKFLSPTKHSLQIGLGNPCFKELASVTNFSSERALLPPNASLQEMMEAGDIAWLAKKTVRPGKCVSWS